MKTQPIESGRAQVLVIVALGLLVLAAFVALAIDGGNLYATRRKMQNAADAGALAGARYICFGPYEEYTSPEDAARSYAEDLNGADDSLPTPDGYKMTVVVTKTVSTYFARVFGFREVDVAANAAALCSGAVAAGNIWPLSIRDEVWDSIPCDVPFYAFVADDKKTKEDPDEDGDFDEISEEFCSICDCTLTVSDIDGSGTEITAITIGPGDRGWLRLFEPISEFPDPCDTHNCGANEQKCWLEHGHPGPVEIGDCLSGKPGVVSSGEKIVDDVGEEGRHFNLVLWDRECGEDDPSALGSCPGTDYHVAGFGCAQIVEWKKQHAFPYQPEHQPETGSPTCGKASVVIAIKRCDRELCKSDIGVGDGTVLDPDDVGTVILVSQ